MNVVAEPSWYPLRRRSVKLRDGRGSVKTGPLVPGVTRRARPVGFVTQPSWGEGDWTARDLR